jgi:transketolase
MIGVDDKFGESGPPMKLMEKYGLTSKDIVKATKRSISRK